MLQEALAKLKQLSSKFLLVEKSIIELSFQ